MEGTHADTSGPGWKPPYYGAIPRVEAQTAHKTFLEAARPSCALLSVIHARRLVKRGLTAGEWAPEGVSVMTTTTIADDALARLHRERELEIVEAFRPAYHVPADYPVYGDDPLEDQREQAARCARGTRWMVDRLPAGTTVVPLIKGSTPAVRETTERAAEAVDAEVAAFYGAQYFTQGGGGGWPALRQDLAAIERETNGFPVVIIGLLSAALLAEAPSNVLGGAGLRQWREAARPRSASRRAIQQGYGGLAASVEAAVGPGGATAPGGLLDDVGRDGVGGGDESDDPNSDNEGRPGGGGAGGELV